jgi:hypothetical protein
MRAKTFAQLMPKLAEWVDLKKYCKGKFTLYFKFKLKNIDCFRGLDRNRIIESGELIALRNLSAIAMIPTALSLFSLVTCCTNFVT